MTALMIIVMMIKIMGMMLLVVLVTTVATPGLIRARRTVTLKRQRAAVGNEAGSRAIHLAHKPKMKAGPLAKASREQDWKPPL